jgi:signal transduction histidine kinase
MLLTVLLNLIVNASRHTEEGRITVDAKDTGNWAEISVSDTGRGIAPEDVPHIFEKGYTTDEGRGLGLAICRETIALHGGELSLAATGPEGSVFRFTVPKEDRS